MTLGTRQEILRVALDLFRTQGYDATSLRQISDRLGITKAALYYHFPAKEHLVVELTRPFVDGLSDIVASARSAVRDGHPLGTGELLGRLLDLILAQHDIVNLLTRDPAAQNHPDVGLRATNLYLALQTELVGDDATDADLVRVACAMAAVSAAAALPATRLTGAREHVLAAALAALRSG
jgi:AcrR family transcriptional regulator